MRLIDADILQYEFNKTSLWAWSIEQDVYAHMWAQSIIENAPTIDAVEVVRCKDCKHSMSDGGTLMECDFHEIYVIKDDFCSYGERKE